MMGGRLGLESGPGTESWESGEQRLTFALLKLLIFFCPAF